KKKTTKKSEKSTTAPVAEEHKEELSNGNNSDDLCEPPSEGMKGLKRKRPSTGGGVSSRTRARKAVSNGNEPVREESNPRRGTTVVSLSLDTESEGMYVVSSKKKIWWKELYASDVAARKFTKTEDKEKLTIVEGSSSNSGLESMLKGVEERIVKAMEEGFSGINLTVETKLEAMNWTMGKLEKNQRGNEDEEYRQWNDFDYGRDHAKDREMAEAEKDKEKAETGKKNNEKGEEDEENSGKDEEDEEKCEKSEKDEKNKPEKDKENSDSIEKGEENVEESDEEDSLLRLRERVKVQAEEFWRTIDDESDDEKDSEKEAEKDGEKEDEKEAEKEVQEGKEAEKDGEKETEKEVQEEKEAEKEESKGTPTSTGKDAEVAKKKDQDVDEEEEKAEESDKNHDVDQDVDEEEEKVEESEDNLVESPSEKQVELAEKSESEDNPVESPAEKQTELAEKSVEV
ncbi:unnamed protein product, partial [Brassica oleracea]